MFCIVYVLVSDEKDCYFEQMVISITSLVKYMSDVNINVLVDENTYRRVKEKKLGVVNVNYISIDIDDSYSNKEKSRYIKTNMRKYIKGDFLFIDVDTVICERLDGIVKMADFSIGCVVDKHFDFQRHPLKNVISHNAASCNARAQYDSKHFNSGVMWVKDDEFAQLFFEKWHSLWCEYRKHGIVVDQISLNETINIYSSLFQELPGIWNCQISQQTAGLQYLENAKIIHYFSSYSDGSVPYDLANNAIIKELDLDHGIIRRVIDHPKTAFECVCQIKRSPKEAALSETFIYKYILTIYCRHKLLFTFIDFLAHCILKVRNLIIQ